MSTRRQGVIFVLTVVSVVVAGVVGVSLIRRESPPEWPGRVAVIGVDEANRRQPVTFLAVVHPGTRAVAIVPPEAVVEIPGAGFLRAFHAYRLGGADLTRATLGRLFGVDVPFSARGPGADLESVAASATTTNVDRDDLDELRAVLDEAVAAWERKEVSGQRKEGEQGPVVILDPASVADAASAIGGLGTKVFVDPTQLEGETLVDTGTPTPSDSPAPSESPAAERIDPADINVQVLNGGEVELAATKTNAQLKGLGYTTGTPGDFMPQDRPASVVYFREGQEAEAKQVGADLGYPAEPLPDDIKAKMRAGADVLVILGHDAKV